MGLLNVKLNDGDQNMAPKFNFRVMVQAFVKLSDSQCNDIFNQLTKKSEPKSLLKGETKSNQES